MIRQSHKQISSERNSREKLSVAFGQVLRKVRLSKGVSQDQLAEICECDRTYPSLLERGLRSPTLAMVLRISTGLGIAATELVARTQDELRAL